ncbi:hypothetical protein LOD99_12441 [Oopsacas minuta]|uniref:Transposase Tc1-like domain-containing protein n=1 Tax=Oopsacas minuta TaxID=111878 RepID=A0AAV7JF17_9METZ|nr:hypothetical protein LOD99_12441 [Oopsacas minuta]
MANKCPVTTSKNTVARALKKLRYTKPYPSPIPLLSEKNRISRIEWAEKNLSNDWQHAISADEASIWIARGRIRMWTKEGTERLRTTVKHTQKVNICAAFSSVGTFPLCIFQEILTAALFVNILEGHLIHKQLFFMGLSGFWYRITTQNTQLN